MSEHCSFLETSTKLEMWLDTRYSMFVGKKNKVKKDTTIADADTKVWRSPFIFTDKFSIFLPFSIFQNVYNEQIATAFWVKLINFQKS